MEVNNTLATSFKDYTASIAKQTDKILEKAQKAHESLESIKVKLEIIQELNFKGKRMSQKRIDELKYGSFWRRLFNQGKLSIVKHEGNLKTLDGLINFVTVASNNVNDIIIKLKHFKADTEDLKQTGVLLETLPHISINRHAQLLRAALKRLSDSKEKFDGRRRGIDEEKEIE